MNIFKTNLANGVFTRTVELVPASGVLLKDHLDRMKALARDLADEPGFSGFSITDRVHSLDDHDPIDVAARIFDASGLQSLLHFSGKGRALHDLRYSLNRMETWGLENLLLVSGDRLEMSTRHDRVRYLESVPAIREARATGKNLLLGGAVCPFKYTEDTAMSQYLKFGRKVSAGADFIVTQLGFDMGKFAELVQWSRERKYGVKIIANVMALTAGRARFIRKRTIPGIVISDGLVSLLEDDERRFGDKGKNRAFERLALQIIGLELLQYDGVQLTGIRTADDLNRLDEAALKFKCLVNNPGDWQALWDGFHTDRSGARLSAAPGAGWYLGEAGDARPSLPERIKFKALNAVHDWIFAANTLTYRAVAPLMRSIPTDKTSGVNQALRYVEKAVKKTIVGCDTCGTCRLAETLYVCPETCPKGLSNGPCGGSNGATCEYGHRECIHLRKYRLAKYSGTLDDLENAFVPNVALSSRNSCSWPNHFREGDG